MKTLSTLGRIIYAVPFVIFGIFHFIDAGLLAGLLKGWPIPEAFIYFSGLAFILAGVSILLNYKARLASLLLALLLLIIIVFVHLPGVTSGSQTALTSLLKDAALLGAALTYSNLLKK
jgi:putative oxidoreductase